MRSAEWKKAFGKSGEDEGLNMQINKNEPPEYLQQRTYRFALRIIRLIDSLPKSRSADHIAGQLLRCGTSVGANYRAACRARSAAEFRSKLGIVEEESDESALWLELLADAKLMKKERIVALHREANEITAMVVASIKSSRRYNS
jgi:four helix bundle protein